MVAKTTQPLHPPIATTLVDASHSHDQQSNNCLASCTGITKEKYREGRKGGRKKRRKKEKQEEMRRTVPGNPPPHYCSTTLHIHRSHL